MGEFWKEGMKDAQFVAALQEMEPEFQAAKEVLRLRLAQGLTQKELAQRVGTKQASISRLERASQQAQSGLSAAGGGGPERPGRDPLRAQRTSPLIIPYGTIICSGSPSRSSDG
jgi:hypothetical protein